MLSVLVFYIPNLFKPIKKENHKIYEELLLQFMSFYVFAWRYEFFYYVCEFELIYWRLDIKLSTKPTIELRDPLGMSHPFVVSLLYILSLYI